MSIVNVVLVDPESKEYAKRSGNAAIGNQSEDVPDEADCKTVCFKLMIGTIDPSLFLIH